MPEDKLSLNVNQKAAMSTSLIDLASLDVPPFVELISQHDLLHKMLDKAITREPMVVKLLEVIAEREEKLRQWVNEMARNVMLATAKGDYLDQIVLLYGVKRLAEENDEDLRQRALLSLDGYGASGSKENYLFHIFSINDDNAIHDVSIVSTAPGEILITLLPTITSPNSPIFNPEGMIERISSYLKVRAPLSDKIKVNFAETVVYAIQVHLELYPNANPKEIQQEIELRLQNFARTNYRLGQSIEASELQSAIYHPDIKSIGLILKTCILKKEKREVLQYDMKSTKRIELKFNQAPYCNYQSKIKKENLDPAQPKQYGIQVSIHPHKDQAS